MQRQGGTCKGRVGAKAFLTGWVQRQFLGAKANLGCKGNSCKGNSYRVGAKGLLTNELILGYKAILGAKAILTKEKQGGCKGNSY